jgi:Fe2+ transport system protein FeoA
MQTGFIQTQTLAELKKGEHAFFLSICGGRGVLSRLTTLGFTTGAELEMRQNFGHGPLVVTIRGTHVALGREEAKKIVVQKGKS